MQCLEPTWHRKKNEDLKIHVFNSRSASIGETLIVKKIVECEEAGMSFERVVETVELYISTQHTYFVLENLETSAEKRPPFQNKSTCCIRA